MERSNVGPISPRPGIALPARSRLDACQSTLLWLPVSSGSARPPHLMKRLRGTCAAFPRDALSCGTALQRFVRAGGGLAGEQLGLSRVTVRECQHTSACRIGMQPLEANHCAACVDLADDWLLRAARTSRWRASSTSGTAASTHPGW
jgi:hypothetical protein